MSKSTNKLPKIIVAAMVVLTTGVYVWQINSLSTSGYKIKELQRNLSTLKKENKDLQNKVVSLRSMDKLEAEISQLAMTNVAKVEYIKPTNKEIAQR